MQINATTAGLNTDYIAAIRAAVFYFETNFKNNITINITFQSTTTGSFLASSQSYGYMESYARVQSGLARHQTSLDQQAAIAALPQTNPFGTSQYFVTTAQEKALGMLAPAATGTDGIVTLNTSYAFTYDSAHRAVTGKYDAIGTIEHEISEILGRQLGSDGSLNVTPEALHRYSSAGAIDTSSAAGGYFSVDGKKLLDAMGETGADLADWASSVKNDAFGYGSKGIANVISNEDFRELNILGYDAPSPFTGNDLAYSRNVSSAYKAYDYIDGLNYIASFSDLIAAYGNNAQAGQTHFLTWGRSENRISSFNGLEYVASYRDLINAYGPNNSVKTVLDLGAEHFILYGSGNESRKTSFNGLDYIASYSDLISAFGTDSDAGAYHYIERGGFESRTATFSGLSYIALYSDLMQAFGTNEQAGAGHYIQFGFHEGRTTSFDVSGYLNAHADLKGQYATNDQFLVAYINNFITNGQMLT